MNPESDGVIIKEHRVISKNWLYVIVAVIAVALVAVAAQTYVYEPPVANLDGIVPDLSSYGLETQPFSDMNIYGSLIFSASANETDSTLAVPYVYAHNMTEDSSVRLRTIPQVEYQQIDSGIEYALMPFEANEQNLDATLLQPARFETEYGVFVPLVGTDDPFKGHLAVSPDDTHYAYTFSDVFSTAIDTTNIALHNRSTGQFTVIEDAARPQFSGESELMYIKADGIYRHNIAAGTSSLVTNLYQDLSPADDFSLSSDGATMIFTSREKNLISVQWFDENGTTAELGRIVSPEATYHSPVVSADGRMYAVLRDGETDEIQIRFIESSEVIKSIPLDQFIGNQVRILDWNSNDSETIGSIETE